MMLRSAKVLLSVSMVILSLFAGEVLLRAIRPEYRALARSVQRQSYRVRENPANFRGTERHPDTGAAHNYCFNSRKCRQDWEPGAKAGSVQRVAFFGDSYTANKRLPVEAGFVELVNAAADIEALNYGCDGSGPGSEYLWWRDETADLDLDVTVYVWCQNDFADLLANRLFVLDDANSLRYVPRLKTAWWRRYARGWALTYAVMDVACAHRRQLCDALADAYDAGTVTRLDDTFNARLERAAVMRVDDGTDRRAAAAVALWTALVCRWNRECQERGERFMVVLVPGSTAINALTAGILREHDIQCVDLWPVLGADPHYRFVNDGHWNESANAVVAGVLTDVLRAGARGAQ